MACWFQDPKTGLPEHRRAKLVSIFTFMDKVRDGAGFVPIFDPECISCFY